MKTTELNGLVGCLIFILLDVVYGESCYNSNNYPNQFQCDHGCCGSKYEHYCCQITTQIIGSVIGGLIVIGVIIGVVIFCCKKKQKGQPSGRGGGILGRLGMRSTNVQSTRHNVNAAPPLTRDPVTGRPIPVPVPHRRSGRIPPPRTRQPNVSNPAYNTNLHMVDLQPPSYYHPTMHGFPISPTAPMPPPYEMTVAPPAYHIDKSVPPPPAYQAVITPGYKPSDYNGGMPPPAD
ncbi:hypothetical protein ACF0H5_014374 [Mactra antiquata]